MVACETFGGRQSAPARAAAFPGVGGGTLGKLRAQGERWLAVVFSECFAVWLEGQHCRKN